MKINILGSITLTVLVALFNGCDQGDESRGPRGNNLAVQLQTTVCFDVQSSLIDENQFPERYDVVIDYPLDVDFTRLSPDSCMYTIKPLIPGSNRIRFVDRALGKTAVDYAYTAYTVDSVQYRVKSIHSRYKDVPANFDTDVYVFVNDSIGIIADFYHQSMPLRGATPMVIRAPENSDSRLYPVSDFYGETGRVDVVLKTGSTVQDLLIQNGAIDKPVRVHVVDERSVGRLQLILLDGTVLGSRYDLRMADHYIHLFVIPETADGIVIYKNGLTAATSQIVGDSLKSNDGAGYVGDFNYKKTPIKGQSIVSFSMYTAYRELLVLSQ